MEIISDLLIENGDLSLDESDEPIHISGLEVVTQDIKHRVIESGLLIDAIGERSRTGNKMLFKKLQAVIELDHRVTPGTAKVDQQGDIITITAEAGDEFIEIHL